MDAFPRLTVLGEELILQRRQLDATVSRRAQQDRELSLLRQTQTAAKPRQPSQPRLALRWWLIALRHLRATTPIATA